MEAAGRLTPDIGRQVQMTKFGLFALSMMGTSVFLHAATMKIRSDKAADVHAVVLDTAIADVQSNIERALKMPENVYPIGYLPVARRDEVDDVHSVIAAEAGQLRGLVDVAVQEFIDEQTSTLGKLTFGIADMGMPSQQEFNAAYVEAVRVALKEEKEGITNRVGGDS